MARVRGTSESDVSVPVPELTKNSPSPVNQKTLPSVVSSLHRPSLITTTSTSSSLVILPAPFTLSQPPFISAPSLLPIGCPPSAFPSVLPPLRPSFPRSLPLRLVSHLFFPSPHPLRCSSPPLPASVSLPLRLSCPLALPLRLRRPLLPLFLPLSPLRPVAPPPSLPLRPLPLDSSPLSPPPLLFSPSLRSSHPPLDSVTSLPLVPPSAPPFLLPTPSPRCHPFPRVPRLCPPSLSLPSSLRLIVQPLFPPSSPLPSSPALPLRRSPSTPSPVLLPSTVFPCDYRRMP
jgi:hypothetical protein